MSLALERVNPVTLHDPRVVQQDRIFPVLKGGQEVLYKQFISTSVSSSTCTFHCPPPSSHVYVDRRVHLQMPVRLKITANVAGAAGSTLFAGSGGTGYLVQPQLCQLRSFPVQRAMETILMTINNQAMSVNIGDIISALEHCNMSSKLKAIDFSKCAAYPCGMSQNFADFAAANGTLIRSPLSTNDTVPSQGISKGAPFVVVTNTQCTLGAVPAGGIVIDFVSTEPLFLSPLYWGDCECDDSAFFGVTGMDFTFNFVGNAGNRMIAIDGVTSGAWTTEATARSSSVTIQYGFNQVAWTGLSSAAFSYSQNQPTLFFQYITPQLVDRGSAMQKVLNYPLSVVQRYPVDYMSMSALAYNAAPNATESATAQPMNSVNVQLNSIPTRLHIFARAQNQALQLNPFYTDSFLRLAQGGSPLNLQWGNRSGLLASASIQQLYDISVRSGCTLSYADWAGLGQASGALTSATWASNVPGGHYYGTGSIMVIDPIDLGLDSVDAPGKLEQITLQINASYQNVSNAPIVPTFYVVAISAGLFTLFNGQASSLIGVLNSNDILNSHKNTEAQLHNYQQARNLYGGNFLSDLKQNLSGLKKKAKAMPMDAAGAGISGAARVSRTALKDRLC